MLSFRFSSSERLPLSILCLGAHADDIEIGCGGTMARLLAEYQEATVNWVVFSGEGVRKDEATMSAARFLSDCADATVEVLGFRDGYFPSEHHAIKDVFERLKQRLAPSLIFTHFHKDIHQDHRVVAELAWNTFRDHLIWEYEIPKYDGDFANPNLFIPLSKEIANRKIETIVDCFPSQSTRPWFCSETFQSLMRLRAIGCRAPEGFAEAFYCRKAIL